MSRLSSFSVVRPAAQISVSALTALIAGLSVISLLISENTSIPVSYTHLDVYKRQGEEAAAGKAGRGISDRWKQAISWILENRPEEMARIRDSLFFTNKQESLGKEAAEALFMGDTGTALRLSPSRIETFSRCPFSHFVTYGLRPEERRVFEASSREIGDVYHRCLMKLTQALTVKGKDVTDPASPWMTVTKEECADLVRREIEAIAGE